MSATNASAESASIDEKRASFEQFAFTVCSNGYVNVENRSYGDTSGEHIYSVEVSRNRVRSCSCPHATYRGITCKHMLAVEAAPLILSSASATHI